MGRPSGSKNKPKDNRIPPPSGGELPKKEETKKASSIVVVNNDIRIDNEANEILTKNNATIHSETSDNNTKVLFNLTAQSVFNIMSETDKDTFSSENNIRMETNLKSDRDSRFRGGTQKELVDAGNGKFDKKSFERTRNEMKKQFGRLDFLEQQIARKRSRVMSEHDGELDFDRLYERNPFYATRIDNNGNARTMDIVIDFSFSVGVDSDKINKYGAICWSVVDLLERSGIQCNVIIQNKIQGLASREGKEKLKTTPNEWVTNIKVKDSSEYVDTVDIARCFSTNFYRRAVFHSWVTMTEAVGYDSEDGLGRVMHVKEQPKAEKGKIHLICDQIMYKDLDMDKIETFIRDAL